MMWKSVEYWVHCERTLASKAIILAIEYGEDLILNSLVLCARNINFSFNFRMKQEISLIFRRQGNNETCLVQMRSNSVTLLRSADALSPRHFWKAIWLLATDCIVDIRSRHVYNRRTIFVRVRSNTPRNISNSSPGSHRTLSWNFQL